MCVYIRFIRKNIGRQTATRIHEQKALYKIIIMQFTRVDGSQEHSMRRENKPRTGQEEARIYIEHGEYIACIMYEYIILYYVAQIVQDE